MFLANQAMTEVRDTEIAKRAFIGLFTVTIYILTIACTDNSPVKVGMSEAEVNRFMGKPSFQTVEKKGMESYLLPRDCLQRTTKVTLYKRFLRSDIVVAFGQSGTVR